MSRIVGLADAVAGFFTGLWSSCVKASRASLAYRVFPDLSDGELRELALIDAYVDVLDDFVDLECVDEIRGRGARALYVRTILLANTLLKSPEAKLFLGEIGAQKVFDTEYAAAINLTNVKTGTEEAYKVLEQLYINQAHGAWFFFAYPARRRLPRVEAERLTEAGILFRTQWLILDHLEDLEEDR